MSEDRATARIDRDKSFKYDELVRDKSSFLSGSSKTDVYILAASIGYYDKKKTPLPSGKQDLFVTTTLGSGADARKWMLKSLAIATASDIAILKSMTDMIEICDAYANYGIDVLYDIHKNSDDEISDVVDRMIEVLEE